MSLLTSAVSMTKAMVQIDSTDPGTYEKAMADWIEQQLSDLSNVLITGALGYLSMHLLHELLLNDKSVLIAVLK